MQVCSLLWQRVRVYHRLQVRSCAMTSSEASVELFYRIGLEQTTADNAFKSPKVRSALATVIREAGVEDGCSRAVGALLYMLAGKYPAHAARHRPRVLSYVTSGQISKNNQIDAALRYVGTDPDEFLAEEFERCCGIGVVVSREDVNDAVAAVVEKNRDKLLSERYRFNSGILLAQVRELQPFADHNVVQEVLDKKLFELLGEKTDEDTVKLTKKRKPKAEVIKKEVTAPPAEETNPYSIFPDPKENTIAHTEIRYSDGTVESFANTKEVLAKHLKETGGRVLTRFPPEPNGFLHIGHSKAMFIDYGLAVDRNGGCYLRFDDTNPTAEKEEYIEHIKEIVEWMGWKPFKITYSSDYFQELYELAVELIKADCAYVDHQTPDEIAEYRSKFMESPWRNRPVEESLALFEDMKQGKVPEGAATLRMKQDMKNENYNMLDLIAYRVKKASHPRTKDKWCIYPSYDFTHCIVDSLENITHSLCTLEFESRRASYYWLLRKLNLFLPYVWEYSRLNMTNNVMSKRKLNELVTKGYVDGWDDPRLLTLAGLRRRGVTPTAINAFCRSLGITRSDNLIQMDKFEHFVRDELNRTSPRTMVVLNPLKVVIENLESNIVEEVEGKRLPDSDATYKIPFRNVVYIEKSDFRIKDSKDYYGLSKGKTVLLRYAYPVTCTDYICDKNDEVVELRVTHDPKKSSKPKGVLHWVPEPAPGVEPLKVELRLFNTLFKSEDPSELGDAWREDINPESKVLISDAFGLDELRDAKVGDRFQFERAGYFCVDPDSTAEKMVFNRTVTLKTSYPST